MWDLEKKVKNNFPFEWCDFFESDFFWQPSSSSKDEGTSRNRSSVGSRLREVV